MANMNVDTELAMKLSKQMILDKLEIAGVVVEGAIKKNLSGANGKELKWVDTGNEMNSVTHEVNEQDLVVRIGTNVEYAVYGEFGTGQFAENGQGRKTGWVYKSKNGLRFTLGTRPHPAFRRGLYDSLAALKKVFAI